MRQHSHLFLTFVLATTFCVLLASTCFGGEPSGVVIVCISGRGGATDSGMVDLRDKLREQLGPLGVKPENIFRRNWNKTQDDNPLAEPDVDDILGELNLRAEEPSYLCLIGHSYGGWAACRVSQKTGRIPDFVALIDPVFGPANELDKERDIPRGRYIHNWYQNNSIIGGDPATELGKIPCGGGQKGLSCGYQDVPGAVKTDEHFLKNWEGDRKRVETLFGKKHILTSHVTMDDNEWVWRQIVDRIKIDLGVANR